jgi:hypothetical protein
LKSAGTHPHEIGKEKKVGNGKDYRNAGNRQDFFLGIQ